MMTVFQMSLLLILALCSLYDAVLVNIKFGNKTFPIKGRTLSVSDKKVYFFSRIPYAKPPIGERRFRYPEELDTPPWKGIYDSTIQPPTCWQGNPSMDFELFNPAGKMWFSKTKMDEDCLYLSIWTPEIKPVSRPLPVMIWIYGGSYMTGSNTLEVYDGSFLAGFHDVIIVTFQFRIGPFGFLFMDHDESPGNQALVDQQMVLKWVNQHIDSFGGDPNSVTVFGESSGATSISLHLFSSKTKDLFKRAILQSGTIFAPWAYESSSTALVKAKYLAEKANCSRYNYFTNNHNKLEMIKCLRNVPPERMVKLNFEIRNQIAESRKRKLNDQGYLDLYSDGAMFFDIYLRPILDEKLMSKEEMQRVMAGQFSTDKELLIGTNSNEAMFFLMYGLSQFSFFNKSAVNLPPKMMFPSQNYVDPYRIVMENILELEYIYSSLAMLILYEYNIKSTRFDDKAWNAKDLLEKLDLIGGDTQFTCPTVQFADSIIKSESTKLYMYLFNSRTTRIPVPEWLGVMHGYEIEYVFGMPFSKDFRQKYYTFSEEEKEISKSIMAMWTNFTKYGNPTPSNVQGQTYWPLYSSAKKEYLKISHQQNGGFTVENRLNEKRCKFWNKILPELRNNLLKRSNGCWSFLNGCKWSPFFIMSLALLIWRLGEPY